jgi:hypothetical protein
MYNMIGMNLPRCIFLKNNIVPITDNEQQHDITEYTMINTSSRFIVVNASREMRKYHQTPDEANGFTYAITAKVTPMPPPLAPNRMYSLYRAPRKLHNKQTVNHAMYRTAVEEP